MITKNILIKLLEGGQNVSVWNMNIQKIMKHCCRINYKSSKYTHLIYYPKTCASKDALSNLCLLQSPHTIFVNSGYMMLILSSHIFLSRVMFHRLFDVHIRRTGTFVNILKFWKDTIFTNVLSPWLGRTLKNKPGRHDS